MELSDWLWVGMAILGCIGISAIVNTFLYWAIDALAEWGKEALGGER